MLIRSGLLLVVLLLAGCGQLTGVPATGQTATPNFSPTEIALVTVTPTMPESCAFAWTDRALPEVSEEVNRAFQDAGLEDVDVEASAFGENCIDPVTNQQAGFNAMQTDFHISVAIDDTDDASVMGEWVERILRVLEAFPPGKVPGPNTGYVGITFGIGEDKVSLWFAQQQARDLMNQGRRGSRLFEALRTP